MSILSTNFGGQLASLSYPASLSCYSYDNGAGLTFLMNSMHEMNSKYNLYYIYNKLKTNKNNRHGTNIFTYSSVRN